MATVPSRRRELIFTFALIALTLAAMWPVLGNDFVEWDDGATVYKNPRLNPPTIANVAYYWAHPHMSLYVPVTYTAWSALAMVARKDMPDASGASLNPWIFHAASLVAHIACAVILMRLLLRLGCPLWPATAGAALFAVHPVQVESVAWASGLKDVLSGAFSLAAVLLYVKFATADDRQIARRWYALAAIAYLLGMLSKPTAIVAPLLAATIDGLILRRPITRVAASIAPLLILSIPCAIWTKHFQPTTNAPQPIVPLIARPVIAMDAINFYLKEIIAPIGLTVHYGRRPDMVWQTGLARWTWIAPAVMGALAIALRRRAPWFTAAVLLFVLGLLPVLGLVPFEFQFYSTVGDHYLYLPMAGVAVGVAFAMRRHLAVASVIVGIAFLAFTIMSNRQARFWHNTITLASRGVQINPNDADAHNTLGGAFDQAGNVNDANAEYHRAIELAPAFAPAWANLGALSAQQGRLDEAIKYFQAALERDPDLPAAKAGLSRALAERVATPTSQNSR